MAFAKKILLFFLLAITCIHSTNGCPDDCSCNSTSLTVICSKFALTWNQIINNIPTNTKQLYLKDGTILEAVTEISTRFGPRGTIPQDVQSLPEVTVVHISSTKVQLDEKTFQPFTVTEELHLVYNSLETLNNIKVFHDLTNIKVLNLSHNLLTELDDELFGNMQNLKVLDLSFNKLNNLPHDIFEVLEGLESLHIDHNELEYIHPHSIGNLTSLHTLHLDSNALETLHKTTLPQNMSSFTRLKLQGNPWDCNCGLVWLSTLLRANASSEFFHDPESIQCYYPLELRGKAIQSLTSEDMMCEAPVITHHPPGNVSIQRVHSHMLHCNATGDPVPAVYWLTPNGVFAQPNHRKYMSPTILELAQRMNFKGIPTYRDSTMEVLRNGSLYFQQVRWYYAGQYACVAENPAGIAVVYVQVKIHEVLLTYVWTSMIYGAIVSIGFFIISLTYASLKLLVEKTCLRQRMKEKADSIISSIEDIEPPSTPLFEGYLSPDWSRDFYISPRHSPTKCVTPSEHLAEDFESRVPIRDTLEDVRVRLHKSVEKQKEKIRTRAQKVKESSSMYMQNIKETGTMKMQTIKESSSQYVKNIRSSGTHAIQGIRSSSSQYAHRVRAGVVMGVEQVKYHVQSMKEFCGTGDIGQTISTVSMSTNVDMGERTEVVKQITYV